MHGQRILSHVRGNPETEVSRSPNTDSSSSTLLLKAGINRSSTCTVVHRVPGRRPGR